ncbi:MAG: fibronectin type III domain-containing protein, partial [Verrucomicrobia bacterium]|nr:fibronectin type III domain-containing protein [Verrucomicrobiota bacterium]
TDLNVMSGGNTQLSLYWPAVTGATGYKVYRRTDWSAWPSTPIGSPTATLFTDIGLTNGTKYYYSVAAVNSDGTGAWSAETNGTPTAVALPAPTNVAVTPGNSQATVTWDPVVGAGQYSVTIAASPGGQRILSGGGGGIPSYTATGLTNGQTYYIRVQSLGNNVSAYSDEVSTIPAVTLPLAPTNIGTKPGNTQLSLTWTAVTGATGYKVYRRTDGSAWSSAPIASPTGTLFTDTGLINGTKYYYSVAAVNAGGAGAWSAEASGTPTADGTPTPVNIAVTPGNQQATVTWNPVTGATSYYVTVATSPGGQATSSSSNTTSPFFTVTGLSNGQTYYFRVQAVGNQFSPFSTEVSAVPNPEANIGNISGRVSVNFAGYSDLGVKNAVVSLQGTSYTASPDANGNFTLLNIPFGDYSLVVTAPNMDTLRQDVSLTGSSLPVTIPPMIVSASLKGDANGDNRLGLADVIYLLQILIGERQ